MPQAARCGTPSNKLGADLYYTIVFRNGRIVRVGLDDYFEAELSADDLAQLDGAFFAYLEQHQGSANAWVKARWRALRGGERFARF